MEILEINDLKKLCRKKVPKMFYDYVDSGSWSEATYKANEEDFRKIKLRQRVGIDIQNRSLSTEILGKKYDLPIGFSPTGMAGMLFPNAEIIAAKICKDNNIPYTLSTMSICSIEQVAERTNNYPFWFQLYVMKDKEFVKNIILRAKKANCGALVLTMDLPVLGQRHNDIRNGLSTPPKPNLKHILQLLQRPIWCLRMLSTKNKTFGNIHGHAKGAENISSIIKWTNNQFDQKITWDYIKWIRKLWDGPLILKGILDEKDAIIAKDFDIDAIIVSNHGGRQLDGTISSISALKRIVDNVGSDIELYFDGGIRSGQDALKALSIGAKAVFIGRPYLYGLGGLGREGAQKVIDIMRKEIDITLALCGENDIKNLNSKNLYEDI